MGFGLSFGMSRKEFLRKRSSLFQQIIESWEMCGRVRGSHWTLLAVRAVCNVSGRSGSREEMDSREKKRGMHETT
jgi:hypothetical protein